MADLSTNYLGLKLRTPLVPSSSVLSMDLDAIRKMEQAGASAVVLYSLFEEELANEENDLNRALDQGSESFAEAITYVPELKDYGVGPGRYLKHLQEAKRAVKIPVIASLNGDTLGGWTSIAKRMAEAGADALELNVYSIPTDMKKTSTQIEEETLGMFLAVKSIVKIPVAVKLSPFYSNMTNLAGRLSDNGADGLVLFNRFYQPDLELESREVVPHTLLSTPMSIRLPLRWIAILYGKVKSSLAATGGIHQAEEAVKMVMVGADVAMMCSALMQNGIDHIKKVEADLGKWMDDHEYKSVSQMKGSLSQKSCPDPSAYERAQYIRTLRTFKPEKA